MTLSKEKDRERKLWDQLERNTASGQGRKRMTRQLQYVLARVANVIAQNQELGDQVQVGGVTYRIIEIRSNLDRERFLSVRDYPEGDGGPPRVRVFDESPGPDGEYYLHQDFNARVRIASREQWLDLTNNLATILGQFTGVSDAVSAEIREAHEKLKALGDRGKA